MADNESPLPPDWSEHISRGTGKKYWFNKRTNESRYERPVAAAPAIPRAVAQPPSFPVVPVAQNPLPAAVAPSSDLQEPPAKRPRPDGEIDESLRKSLNVAAKYNDLEALGVEGRLTSSILHLRGFNNWVKATLAAQYAPKPAHRVLDLACGKLGDWHKWKHAGVQEYCGIDIAANSIQEACARFNERNTGNFVSGKFAVADLGITDITATGLLDPTEKFDVISIQFALHYLFQTERRALTFFANLKGRLKPGGVFLGTIPDAAYIVRRLRDLPDGELSFGNSIYNIEFTSEGKKRQYAIGDNPYGIEYQFYLAESVEEIPEYIVPWPLLERLAHSIGLKTVANENFHDFWARWSTDPHHSATVTRLKAMDVEGTMSPEQWEAAGVYRVFVFQAPLDGETTASSSSVELPSLDQLVHNIGRDRYAPASFGYKSYVNEADVVDVVAAMLSASGS